jgi:glycosyltransferase involved in cell wall biosynthesis
VAVVVDNYDVMFLKKILYILCDRLTQRFVNKFIVVSQSLQEFLIKEHGIAPDKVTKIYNGIELDQYKPNLGPIDKFRKEFLSREDELVVGSVGRLTYEKGHEFLLKSMPKVLESFPRTKFVLVGDGQLKLKLENLAKELEISQTCMFLGFRDDIPQVLSSFDVFVLPSIMEGHPIAILEAMAMAKPIVASDINGIREQIENRRTGLLVPPGDPQALAKAINQMLKDRNKARKMGIEARKRVDEMYDIKRQVALHEEVYKEIREREKTSGRADG